MYTFYHLYFDDVEVGQEWESPGRTVTEADILHFAGLSGDFNPIHVDHHYAQSTPFGRPIAHGLLTLALASGLSVHCPPMRTLALVAIRDWQFRQPVFIGDTLRVRSKVLAKEARGRGKRGLITWQRQVINQHGAVVQEGVTVTLVEARPGNSPRDEPPAAD
ncbi:MAG: MaoC/PaaZ C-terminal domain-containing protein [Gemmatales bacterium]|nr:MaoC/PaaZ C-terminal domain-containing protein [Gemmatales bacterium]MDW7995547.1 MaoC/PaaZ C-terminal domain-containing protein [Gemmatales bacterium]